MLNERKTLLRISEAADMLGVSVATIRNWHAADRIAVIKTMGGHRRIPVEEVRRILEDNEGDFRQELVGMLKAVMRGLLDHYSLSADILSQRYRWKLNRVHACQMLQLLSHDDDGFFEYAMSSSINDVIKKQSIMGFKVAGMGVDTALEAVNTASVLMGFPGVGKTFLYENNRGLDVLDSDSSKFDKSYFPDNYVQHVEDNLHSCDLILVSSHKSVREALKKADISYTLFIPSVEAKDEYINRFTARGSSDEFTELISANWEEWLKQCSKDTGGRVTVLTEGQYLTDAVFKEAL